MKKVLLATRNKDKVKEIRQLLKNLDLEIFTVADFPNMPEVIEDQDTISGNAIKKAQECAEFSRLASIADDTGLFVESLDGEPGVFSARFAGKNCSYKDNREKMLRLMKGKKERMAEFRTVVAFATPDGVVETLNGNVQGKITKREFGENGFGYDAIFRANKTGKTFGEMTRAEKEKISHRARALKKLFPILENYLKSDRKM